MDYGIYTLFYSKATNIAASMVKEYGMSKKVGKVYVAGEKQARYLNIPNFPTLGVAIGIAEYSQATAEMIDSEIREIINEQYEIAIRILKENINALKKSAEILLEKETFFRSDLMVKS